MMRSNNVLLIEDGLDTQLVVKNALEGVANLTAVASAAEALRKMGTDFFPLVLLDVNLPDGDGFELYSKIRDLPNGRAATILFLTGKGSSDDKVRGFYLGADDYIVKPFDPIELRARIAAKLNNLKRLSDPSVPITKGPFTVNLATQRISLRWEGMPEKSVELTGNQFKILLYLIRNDERPVSREELLREIWGDGVHVSGRTIDTHMHAIRQELGDLAKCIQSIHGKGYCFTTKGLGHRVA